MKKDFIPNKQEKLYQWEQLFVQGLANHASALGISTTQVDAITDMVDVYRAQHREAEEAKKTAKSKVKAAQEGRVTTVRAIRKLVRLIKASPGYTDSMGKTMGIIGPEDSAMERPPVLKVTLIGGHPVISYRKGSADGIVLYCMRGDEEQMTLLAVDTRSPYADTRPNLQPDAPEARHYMAYFLKNDEQVGQPSATAQILVAGR